MRRPNVVAGVNPYLNDDRNIINPAAFSIPLPGTYGDLPRNAAVGPDYWNFNLAVSRLIGLAATQRVELRLEAFNLFNRFNWGLPVVKELEGVAGEPVGARLGHGVDGCR